ncbi:MAG TPA: YceI family protein [Aquabacterium sp.]|nr:YceI family protein [Aquabacterium sp.]HRH27473.1 YceI family protein [Aquabacterium sp.]
MTLSRLNGRLMGWTLMGALCLPVVTHAAAPVTVTPARLLPAASEVTFTARQIGVPLEGRFKRFDAQIALDPKQPQSGKVSFSVDLGSVSVGPETDAELIKPEWFNAVKFPKATFVSTVIQSGGPGRFQVTGKLMIKGQSRDLVVPVTLSNAGAQTVATGSFMLKRLDFKVGDGDWADTSVVANEVQVRFKLALQGLPAF